MQTNKNTNRPWTPLQILAISVLFGPAAGGAVAGVNFIRLGKPQMYLLLYSVIGVILTIAEAWAFMFLVPEEMIISLGLLVNIMIGLGFMLEQKPKFDAWKTSTWEPEYTGERYKPNRLGLLFFVAIIALAVEVGIVLMFTPFKKEPVWAQEWEKELIKFQEPRIYRLSSTIQSADGDLESSKNSIILGYLLKKDYTEIEDFMCSFEEDHLVYKKKEYDVSGYYVDILFCRDRYIPLIQGDPRVALAEPNSVVLTETLTQKLFDLENPMMKIITVNGQDCVVKGICMDLPAKSKLSADFFVSYPTLLKKAGYESFDKTKSENLWEFDVYTDVVVAEGFTIGEFINDFSMDISSPGKGQGILRLNATPFSDVY